MLEDPLIDNIHAKIIVENSKLYLIDNNSANGYFNLNFRWIINSSWKKLNKDEKFSISAKGDIIKVTEKIFLKVFEKKGFLIFFNKITKE